MQPLSCFFFFFFFCKVQKVYSVYLAVANGAHDKQVAVMKGHYCVCLQTLNLLEEPNESLQPPYD